jgi:hypothetical protein
MAETPDHKGLPLPDYDHIPLATLPSRIHGLDASGLEELLAFEEAHGNRLPVKQVLQQRLEDVRGGAEPSGGLPEDLPEKSSASGQSPVSPETAGPKINPPSQGVPTNPAQPRH